MNTIDNFVYHCLQWYTTTTYKNGFEFVMSTKFRQQKFSEMSSKIVSDYINWPTSTIDVYCMCGWYKQPTCMYSPNADLAEFFHIGYMCKWAVSLANITKKRVNIYWRFHVWFIQHANNYSSSSIQHYYDSFLSMIKYYRIIFPNLWLQITYPRPLHESLKRYNEVKMLVNKSQNNVEISDEQLLKADRNIDWVSVGNIHEKEKASKIKEAFLIDKYFLDNDEYIKKNTHHDKITIYRRKFLHHEKLVYRSIEKVSIQFWAGTWWLLHKDNIYYPRIFPKKQIDTTKKFPTNVYTTDKNILKVLPPYILVWKV